MGWRTIVVDSRCKIAYKNGYIVLKKEQDAMVHLSEIDILVIATTQASFTCVALNELIKSKVKVIFCDEKYKKIAPLKQGDFSFLYKKFSELLPFKCREERGVKKREIRHERMRLFLGIVLLHGNKIHVLSVEHRCYIFHICRHCII